jgi:simple sugar transport system substrate-binding protein
MKPRFARSIGAAAVLALAVLTGCAQEPAGGGGAGGGQAGPAPGQPCERTVQNDFAPPADKPAGFKDGFTVALVRQSGVGDYFEQWGRGAQAQIEAAGGKVTSFDARGDNARQVTQFNDAIAAKPNVIIVDHGLADSGQWRPRCVRTARCPTTSADSSASTRSATCSPWRTCPTTRCSAVG